METDDRQYNRNRCAWCGDDELYVRYHDEEWGVPVHDRDALFERLILESMQAGLAWITVLRKRDHMRSVFCEFDPGKLAECGDEKIEEWLADPGIIRHRGKLEAMVQNARVCVELDGFADMLWAFAPPAREIHQSMRSVPSKTAESEAMSRALKQLGCRFVGPTICYAFMQSVGMVNDHVAGCWRYAPCEGAQRPVS